jgi:hypothetical protein
MRLKTGNMAGDGSVNRDNSIHPSVQESAQLLTVSSSNFNCKFGNFQECPNGKECHYKHALPPGYVLKDKSKDSKTEEVDEDDLPTIEEEIEAARQKLNLSKCTPLTLERFQKWKLERTAKKVEEAKEKAKTAQKQTGSNMGLSGRDLFRFDPSLFVDDEGADDEQYIIESDGDEEEQEVKNYDPDAQKESKSDGEEEEEEEDEGDENVTVTHLNEDEEEKERDEVGTAATAIDKNLFLDDDIPDDDDEEDDA